MNLIEVTSIDEADLPLDRYRDHLRLGRGFDDDALQDALLESTLLAAISAIEQRTGKALLSRQFRYRVAEWETGTVQSLPRGPLQAIERVSVVQRDGTKTDLASQSYVMIPDAFRPAVQTLSVFPQIPSGGSAEIAFTAGYGAGWADVPDSLGQAVFILAAHFYETRDGESAKGLPAMVRALTSVFRDVRLWRGRSK